MLPPTYYDPAVMNVPVTADAAAAAAAPSNTHAWKDGSFSFHDILDTLNPLQHIPVVSSIYRWLTGDEPGNVARIVGDGLYGGPIGLGAGLISVAFKEETGKDPGEMAMAALTGETQAEVKLGEPAASPAPQAAAAAPSPPASPPPAVAARAPAIQPTPHPFLPLYGAAPPAPATAAASSPAEQAFLAQNAAYQRSIYGQRAPALQRPTTAPIPLQLTGAQLPMVAPRPAAPPVAATAAAPTVPPLPVPPGLPVNPPVDIPQRMMDALDKYARMQQQQQQRGQQVDVSP